jgi:stage II sporulation protein D
MVHRYKIFQCILCFLLLLILVAGCSDEKGPTVPGAGPTPIEIKIERNQDIRIGLLGISPATRIFFSITRGGYDIILGPGDISTYNGFAGQTWHVDIRDDKFLKLVNQSGKIYDIPQEFITVRPTPESTEAGHLLIGDTKDNMRPYRGKLEVSIENDRLLAVNIAPMEEYLLGVVPAEMPPGWPAEALKAQAVAARSYAYFNLGRFDYRNFDLADTVVSQAYSGVWAETEATTNAVVDTEGMVVTYNGNLADTLYHSTCGGKTASAVEIFEPTSEVPKYVDIQKQSGGMMVVRREKPATIEVPYLTSVDDKSPWDYDYCKDSPFYSWEHSYSMDALQIALARSIYTDPGGRLSSITVGARTVSGWVSYILVSGERDHVATGGEFRGALNQYLEPNALPSANFEVTYANGQYTFSGKGFGHGVGMCQWGAKGRADDGIGYENIIKYYYPGCEITEIPYSGGMTFYRDKDFFLLRDKKRDSGEIIGLGREYIPPEEMETEEGVSEETSTGD